MSYLIGFLAAITMAQDAPRDDVAGDDTDVVVAVQKTVTNEAEFAQCVYDADRDLAFKIVSAKTQEGFQNAMNLAVIACQIEGSMSLAKLNRAFLELFPDFRPGQEEDGQ